MIKINDVKVGQVLEMRLNRKTWAPVRVLKVNRKSAGVKLLETVKTARTQYHKGEDFRAPYATLRAAKFLKAGVKESDSPFEDEVEAVCKLMLERCTLVNPPGYIKNARNFLEGSSLSGCRERDSQRSKIYRAESTVTDGERFLSLAALRKYHEKFTGSAWFRRRFGNLDVTLEMNRSTRKSYALVKSIKFSHNHLCQRIYLHELAHILVPAAHAAHGRLFARIYLELVRHEMGEGAYQDLKQAFKAARVKSNPYKKARV